MTEAHPRQSQLDRLNGVDFNEILSHHRAEAKAEGDVSATYPRYSGALQFWVNEATYLSNQLMRELMETRRKLEALERAVELTMDDSEVEELYDFASKLDVQSK